ncbi:hypothetical protein V8D89_004941 [Ganoderma adspersum]
MAVEDIRPEIDRTDLRKRVLELIFTNGFTTTEPDFFVGTDGTHSHIRPLISRVTLTFPRLDSIEILLVTDYTKLPELPETVKNIGRGMLMATHNSRISTTHQQRRRPPHEHLPQHTTVVDNILRPVQAKAVLLEHFAGSLQWLYRPLRQVRDVSSPAVDAPCRM